MPVLIKDMDMPEGCEGCPLLYDCIACPLIDDAITIRKDKRDEACPLSEPTPQIEYIYGYRIKDLVVVAEQLRNEKIHPRDLKMRGDAYVKGWQDCDKWHKELERQVVRHMNEHIHGLIGEKEEENAPIS